MHLNIHQWWTGHTKMNKMGMTYMKIFYRQQPNAAVFPSPQVQGCSIVYDAGTT